MLVEAIRGEKNDASSGDVVAVVFPVSCLWLLELVSCRAACGSSAVDRWRTVRWFCHISSHGLRRARSRGPVVSDPTVRPPVSSAVEDGLPATQDSDRFNSFGRLRPIESRSKNRLLPVRVTGSASFQARSNSALFFHIFPNVSAGASLFRFALDQRFR